MDSPRGNGPNHVGQLTSLYLGFDPKVSQKLSVSRGAAQFEEAKIKEHAALKSQEARRESAADGPPKSPSTRRCMGSMGLDEMVLHT